jgi:hypothetical protein
MPTELQRNGDYSDFRGTSGNLIPIFNPYSTRANPNGSGFVRDPFPGNVIPAALLDPVAVNFTKTFVPLPNRQPSDPFTNANNYERLGSGRRDMRQFSIKADHRISQKNSAFVRYTYYKWVTDISTDVPSIYPSPALTNVKAWDVKNQNFVVSNTHTFSPTSIHEIRVSLARGIFPFRVGSAGDGWPQKLGLPAN